MTYSINQFSEFFHVSRPRLTRLVEAALRTHSGVFGLESLGYFKASRPEPGGPFFIELYNPSFAEREELPLHPLDGRAARWSERCSAPASDPASPSPASALAAAQDAPTKYSMELRLMEARARSIEQKNLLEQARLREETVSYCASAFQLLLSGLRSDISELDLPASTLAMLRDCLNVTLEDLVAVLPDIVNGVPVDQIELAMNSRRAARILQRKQSASALSSASSSPASSQSFTSHIP